LQEVVVVVVLHGV